MNALILDMGSSMSGESSLPGYEGKIELLSFSHAVAMQITGDSRGEGRSADRPIHQDMTVTKYLDASTPVLNQACCAGLNFPHVEVMVASRDGGRVIPAMVYKLRNVIITSVSIAGGGGDKPTEALTLNYDRITWTYTRPAPRGEEPTSVGGAWDLAANSAE